MPIKQSDLPETDSAPHDYRLARQSWDERYGSLIASRQQWKLAAFGSLFVAALAVLGCIHLGSLPKTVPVLFREDTSGAISYAGPAKEMTLDDPKWDAIKHSAFVNFIDAWRTVTSDRAFQDRLWDRAFSFIGKDSPANTALRNWYSENSPHERSSKELVSVHVDFDGPITANTYEIAWTEIVYPLMGEPRPTQSWKAIFTYAVKPPGDPAYNPFGIFITQITSLSPVEPKKQEEQ